MRKKGLDEEPEVITTTSGPETADGVIKSAKRVLEVFEYFAQKRRPLGVSEVVRGLNYPQSSTSALLKSLVKLGYLSFDRYKRTYVPTMRAALLAGWVHDELYSPASLSSMIDSLHARSGATVLLGMQNDTFVQYIHVVQTPTPGIPWHIKPGSLRPLCRSAIGKALLSRKTDIEVLYLLRRVNAEEPDPNHRVNGIELLKELDEIRRYGYAYTEASVTPGASVVAIELPTPASQPPMAIGVGGGVDMMRAHQGKFIKMLNDATQIYRPPERLD